MIFTPHTSLSGTPYCTPICEWFKAGTCRPYPYDNICRPAIRKQRSDVAWLTDLVHALEERVRVVEGERDVLLRAAHKQCENECAHYKKHDRDDWCCGCPFQRWRPEP